MKKLNWKNLLDMQCPKCSGKLKLNKQISQFLCLEECGFGGIYEERFEQIVSDMYKEKKKPLVEFENIDRSNFE